MTLDEISKKGQTIYNKQHRVRLEAEHYGHFAAIDVTTSKVYTGRYPEDALDAAKEQAPEGEFFLVKIGSRDAFKTGVYGESEAVKR